MSTPHTIVVSTDGSALRNPNGPMGWAWVEHTTRESGILSISGKDHDCGGASNGTNQIGELCAVLQALRSHPGDYDLIIETDSQYAINCSTTWLKGWKKNGWKNSKKEPVKNADVIKAIDRELSARKGSVKFLWVKGHAGNYYNERTDDLARGFATKAGEGRIEGYLPEEGWDALLSSPYAQGVVRPQPARTYAAMAESGAMMSDAANVQETIKISDSSTLASSASLPSISEVSAPSSSASAIVDQPLFAESHDLISEDVISRLNSATERFDVASERLEAAIERANIVITKLDEAVKRFDDTSWKRNHQQTLF